MDKLFSLCVQRYEKYTCTVLKQYNLYVVHACEDNEFEGYFDTKDNEFAGSFETKDKAALYYVRSLSGRGVGYRVSLEYNIVKNKEGKTEIIKSFKTKEEADNCLLLLNIDYLSLLSAC